MGYKIHDVLVGANSTHNCSLPTNNTIQITLSKVLTRYTIFGFTYFISSVECICTYFLLQLLFPYFPDFYLSSLIKICD